MKKRRIKRVPRRFAPQNIDLSIKRSRAGRGLFTNEDIPRGTCIIEYIGRPASKIEMETDGGKYFFWTSRNTMIDGNIAGNRARFANHSCVPNCEVDIRHKRIYIFAKRAIKSGEELMYDYDKEYFDEFIKPIGCICPRCTRKRAEAK